MTDQGASVIARLKEKAARDGLQLQLLLNLFCQEEFLRRIQKSRYGDNLVLKGGFLLYSISGYAGRPTIDADYLLQNRPNELGEVERMVAEIIRVPGGARFLRFEIKNLELIAEHRKYNGIRVSLLGFIKNTRTPFSIDFGVGDVVVPSPLKRVLPVLMPDFEPPEVLTYSLESVIAEKFDAIISRMELTSRMKDFFDIYYLATTCDFEGDKLRDAVSETLLNRRTFSTSNAISEIKQFSQDPEMMIRWRAFCKKTLKCSMDFRAVLVVVADFLEPVYKAILDEEGFSGTWLENRREWRRAKQKNDAL